MVKTSSKRLVKILSNFLSSFHSFSQARGILVFLFQMKNATLNIFESFFENPYADPEVRHSNMEESVLCFIRSKYNLYSINL